MELDILLTERDRLNKDISNAVGALVGEFKTKTSVSPQSINISMIDVTEMGDKKRQYLVAETSVSLEIENI